MSLKLRALAPFAALILAVVLLQVGVSTAGKTYYLTQVTMAVYYAIVVLGLSLLMGYAGQVSLGHGAFFALGGYSSAFLTTHPFGGAEGGAGLRLLEQVGVLVRRSNLYDGTEVLTGAPWAAFGVAMLVTLLVATLVGYPSLRLKGHYLAMATLGFGLIVYRLFLGTAWLGAADGINGVPPWSLGFGLSVSGKSALRIQNYYLAWGLGLAVLALLLNLVDSRVGRAFRAIHNHETAANAMGIDTARLKLQAFVASAVLAAAAGSFLTHFNEGIGPSEASAYKSVRYVALVAAGGMANLWGALLVSVVLNFLSLRGYFGTYDNAVFGLILILIVALAPEGPLRPLGRWARQLIQKLRGGQEAGHGAA